MTAPHRFAPLSLLVLLIWLSPAPAQPEGSEAADFCAPDPHRELILEGIGYNFAGDYDAADQVWLRLAELEPDHPAAGLFASNTEFWRISTNDSTTEREIELVQAIDSAVESGDRRLAANPDDPHALLYRGQALMNRARLSGMQGEFLKAVGAARGSAKDLERANELCPEMVDASFAMGMANYYSGALPEVLQFLKLFRWILPIGDQEEGLEQLDAVRREGDLNRDYASFLLSDIFTYFEEDRRNEALELKIGLLERYPTNAIFRFELMELQFELERYDEVVDSARTLGETPAAYPHFTGVHDVAVVWRARAQLAQGRPEEALQLVAHLPPEGPAEPFWAGAWTMLVRAQAYDLLGEREQARALYQQIKDLPDVLGSDRATHLAEAGLDEPFRATHVATGVGSPPPTGD